MMRIDCHFRDDDSYITLPDEWLAYHQLRYQEAIDKLAAVETAGGTKYPVRIANFIVAMALLVDWKLPHMPANPAEWEIEKVPNTIMAWVWNEVGTSYFASFVVPKKNLEPSSNGQPETAEMTADWLKTAV